MPKFKPSKGCLACAITAQQNTLFTQLAQRQQTNSRFNGVKLSRLTHERMLRAILKPRNFPFRLLCYSQQCHHKVTLYRKWLQDYNKYYNNRFTKQQQQELEDNINELNIKLADARRRSQPRESLRKMEDKLLLLLHERATRLEKAQVAERKGFTEAGFNVVSRHVLKTEQKLWTQTQKLLDISARNDYI